MKLKVSEVFLLINICLCGYVAGQNTAGNISVQQYIQIYRDIAIRKMKQYKIPASITLAQGILESANGNSDLAREANNHFGIKCHDDWNGATFYKDDDQKHECFRKYGKAEDSFEDHTRFLTGKPRYAFLFELDPRDYEGWAYGLKKAGYATDPDYPKRLLKIIGENRLNEFDGDMEENARETAGVMKDSVSPYFQTLAGKEVVEVVGKGYSQRNIMKNNRVKFIILKRGDSMDKVCKDLEMKPWQISKYNDLEDNARLKGGQVIYLQPKRRRGEEKYHTVKAGDTMYMISQLYGVKLKLLYRKNRMEPGTPIKAGQKLWLKSRKPKSY